MLASIEKSDGTYETKDFGDYVCGRDYCDDCGDCLSCYGGDPCSDDGGHVWVIYLDNPINPYFKQKEI